MATNSTDAERSATYKYVISLNSMDSKYYCEDTETGMAPSSNTDAKTVIQYAIDNASGRSIFIKAGTYQLAGQLNCVNKAFRMIGERAATSGAGGDLGDTILQANYTGTSGQPFIDCTNTSYTKQQFEYLVIDCNSKAYIGITCGDTRERFPFLRSVGIFNAKDTGLRTTGAATKDYCTFYDVQIDSCTNFGIHIDSASSATGINTWYFYGGHITNCGINVQVDVGNDWGFYGTILEGFTTSAVKHAAGVDYGRYRDCSFEYATLSNLTVIDEDGNNMVYDGCRFDADNTAYKAFNIGADARNIKIVNNNFQANNASTTATITIANGALRTYFIGNTQATNTPLTVTVTDNSVGNTTRSVANTFLADE